MAVVRLDRRGIKMVVVSVVDGNGETATEEGLMVGMRCLS